MVRTFALSIGLEMTILVTVDAAPLPHHTTEGLFQIAF